jgi:hypothetical protein
MDRATSVITYFGYILGVAQWWQMDSPIPHLFKDPKKPALREGSEFQGDTVPWDS